MNGWVLKCRAAHPYQNDHQVSPSPENGTVIMVFLRNEKRASTAEYPVFVLLN